MLVLVALGFVGKLNRFVFVRTALPRQPGHELRAGLFVGPGDLQLQGFALRRADPLQALAQATDRETALVTLVVTASHITELGLGSAARALRVRRAG